MISCLNLFLIIRRTFNIAIDKIKRLKEYVSKLERDPGKIQMCQVIYFSQVCTGSYIFCALKEPTIVKAENVG